MTKKILAGAVLACLGIGAYVGLSAKPEPAARQPRNPVQTVRTVRAEQRALPITLQANGYVTPINTVDVRPQVQNVVRSVHVREGENVRAGQLLITLDERGAQSNVAQAQAEVARGRAELAEAEMALQRNQDLLARNFVSQAVVDSARSKVDALRGTLQANQAATHSSAIALGNNRITASISGRIGAISVHPGSLAQPSGDPMLTISQLDPVAVSFSLPERELANIRATYPDGKAPVTAVLPGKRELQGTLVFIDNAADMQSGTIRMKAQFDNRDLALWPGTYVNVRLASRTLADAVVVPAQAVVTGPVEKFVYVVRPDETVQQQKVEVVAVENGMAVLAGLPANMRVVVEGTQNLRPDGKVKEAAGGGADKTAALGKE